MTLSPCLEIMFKSEKMAKCMRCQEPIPACDYALLDGCTLPEEQDGEIEPCQAKIVKGMFFKMQCPLALCYACRLDLRRQAIMLNRMDKILIAEAQKILSRPYKRTFVPEDNGFSASMPELPGCFTCGESLPEAYESLHEVALGWIVACLEAGEDVPKPEMED